MEFRNEGTATSNLPVDADYAYGAAITAGS